jgi:hypothetical protein
MVVILVHWLIRKGSEETFKTTWRSMSVQKHAGLYREILTIPQPQDDPKFNTFSITDTSYSTFINIGIWKSLEDFDREIAQYIPPSEEKIDPKTGRKKRLVAIDEFEFKMRERIVLGVIADRDGGEPFPPTAL